MIHNIEREEPVGKRWPLGSFSDLPPTRLSANGNIGLECSKHDEIRVR